MNRYQTLQKKAVGLGFILGPLLMMLGAAAYVMGIGLTPFGTEQLGGWHTLGLWILDFDPRLV
jgi:hypothetical protein